MGEAHGLTSAATPARCVPCITQSGVKDRWVNVVLPHDGADLLAVKVRRDDRGIACRTRCQAGLQSDQSSIASSTDFGGAAMSISFPNVDDVQHASEYRAMFRTL